MAAPNLHADAGREAYQIICQFLIAETCSIFLSQVYLIFHVESMLILVCCFKKKICGINQVEDMWPDLLHRHTSTRASFGEWSVVSTWIWIWASPKSLLATEFRLVFDLINIWLVVTPGSWPKSIAGMRLCRVVSNFLFIVCSYIYLNCIYIVWMQQLYFLFI